jgi:hypothetical protein
MIGRYDYWWFSMYVYLYVRSLPKGLFIHRNLWLIDMRYVFLLTCVTSVAAAFRLAAPFPLPHLPNQRHRHGGAISRQCRCHLYVLTNPMDETIHPIDATATSSIDPKKEAVKIFGRLAEKYIALDSSGGNCCYSACTDCEYRLPGGGYIMADQSASRPKWIPHYETRMANQREHVTKWSRHLFIDGPVITKEEFVNRVIALEYSPPLGGPYVAASGTAARIDNVTMLQHLFDQLAEGKTKLTKHKMSTQLKQLADGEEGMTWQSFERALQL